MVDLREAKGFASLGLCGKIRIWVAEDVLMRGVDSIREMAVYSIGGLWSKTRHVRRAKVEPHVVLHNVILLSLPARKETNAKDGSLK